MHGPIAENIVILQCCKAVRVRTALGRFDEERFDLPPADFLYDAFAVEDPKMGLSMGEFSDGWRSIDPEAPQEKIDETFAMYDFNEDGSMDWDEF